MIPCCFRWRELNANATDGYVKFALTEMTQGDTPEELRVRYVLINSADAAEGFWGTRYTLSGDETFLPGCDGLRQRKVPAGVQWRMDSSDDHEREWRQLLMAEFLTFDTDLTAVANAIRAKGGTSAQLIYPSGFVSAIQAIQTGITPKLVVTTTPGAAITATPAEGFKVVKGTARC